MKNEIKKIYYDAFGQDEIFFGMLYEKASNCCKVLKVDSRIVSFFFLLPIELKKGNLKQKAYYLFAAATDKNFRNKGYMGKLLKSEISKCEYPIILKPATNSLIAFYEKFGFKEMIASHEENKDFCILPIKEFESFLPEKD